MHREKLNKKLKIIEEIIFNKKKKEILQPNIILMFDVHYFSLVCNKIDVYYFF